MRTPPLAFEATTGVGAAAPGEVATARLRTLYDAHAGEVRALLFRLLGTASDADDCLHETFLVAIRRQAYLDARVASPRAWLFGVAIKVATKHRRRAAVRALFGLEEAEHLADPETPAGALERADERRLVYAALERLNERKRAVFILFELEGMTGEEIAATVGCPVKTVWSRLKHARTEFTRAWGHVCRDARRPG